MRSTALGLAIGVIIWNRIAAFDEGASRKRETEEDSDDFEAEFNLGTEAYLDNNWEMCVSKLEKALKSYARYRRSQARCRIECGNGGGGGEGGRNVDVSASDGEISTGPPDEMPEARTTASGEAVLVDGGPVSSTASDFYENVVKNALCLMQCEKKQANRRRSSENEDERPPGSSSDASAASPGVVGDNREIVEQDFANKVPYDYLQLCYFKLGNHQRAASCAYTFLVHNPDHDVMQNNLKYYLDLPDVKFNDVTYLEAQNYQDLFFEASKAYGSNDYVTVVDKMEEALREYFVAEEECRALCEGSLPSSPQASFVVSIAHHYTFTLRCKVKCPYELSLGHGDVQQDLLPSFFHYLQFSYYRVGAIRKACEAVASYLFLRPNDTVMLDNQLFYETLDGVKPEWFVARKEVIDYSKRYDKETTFLSFIDREFNFTGASGNYSSKLTNATKTGHPTTLVKKKQLTEGQKWAESSGVKVTMDEVQLKGTKRFVADNLASKEECQQLVHLAGEGATDGDGYNGKLSPHTEFETFEGLTIGRAVTLAHKGLIDPLEAQLFLNASEKARKYVEIYFNLTSTLYFAYTHLVCRTALNDKGLSRNDLSHPVHADNCLLTKEGECLKQRPAYTWRDYSAILYLNDNFEGGEFIFAKNKDSVEASVKPSCGRMVGFSAGKENLHGVQAVVKGRRCALAMWYTLDARHQEKERTIAEQAIAELVRNKIELGSDVPTLSPPSGGHLLKSSKDGDKLNPADLNHPSHLDF